MILKLNVTTIFVIFMSRVYLSRMSRGWNTKKYDLKHLISKFYNQTNIFGECSRKELFKGGSDKTHFVFEINEFT